MATKTTIVLEDDLDGGRAEVTVRFGLGGTEYEIDLSAANATAFRRRLAPFVSHARPAGRRQLPRPASSRARSSDIRAWAKGQGIRLSDRGRLPAFVTSQYENARRENPDPGSSPPDHASPPPDQTLPGGGAAHSTPVKCRSQWPERPLLARPVPTRPRHD